MHFNSRGHVEHSSQCKRCRHGAWLLAMLCGLLASSTAHAQALPGVVGRQAVPTTNYYAIFGSFFEGEYDRALRDFQSEGRGAIKTVESNWIDSICYHAMAGECYYEMGQLAKAQVHYDAALQLYVAFSDWLIRCQFQPPTIAPANPGQVRVCPWGQSQRPARWANMSYDDTQHIAQGQVNNNQVVQQGGVVRQAQLFPLRPAEIVRATALAIRRRRELLGPLGETDQLTRDVLAALTRRPTQPNHWTEAWIDVQLGLAFTAAGKSDQAKPVLERSILAAGEFNHPLTSVALLELGKIFLNEGDFASAAKLFEEATYTAFQYEDAGILEEAFRYGTSTHIISNQQGVYPPLVNAANWARVQGYRQLQASLNLMMAESLAIAGENEQASAALSTARGLLGNRAIMRGKLGNRLNFLTALTLYQQGDAASADSLIANVLAFQSLGSPWMYQINVTDAQLTQGTLAPRASMEIYQRLLREPTASDWLNDPLEALSVISIPHPQSYEHWFEVALGRRETAAALDIADQGRRHRFLASLPLGGRPLGLRWILEAPDDSLSQNAKLERQELIARYPIYDQLAQQARAIQAELAKLPLVTDDAEARRTQTNGLKRLIEISAAQEEWLRVMSVRRNPGSLYFPLQRQAKQLQAGLNNGQAVLAFAATSRHYYGFLITHEGFNSWEINAPAAIHRKVGTLLREMGLTDANRELPLEQLNSEKWKKPARELWTTLTDSAKTDLFEGLNELIIVPDKSLWYVPFAALQVGPDGQSQPLISKVRLRMAPLVSMSIPGARGRAANASTAVVVGKLFGRDGAEVAAAAYNEFSKSVPGTVSLAGTLPVPAAAFGSLVRRLVVFDDLRGTDEDSLGWTPIPLDSNGERSPLASWMNLPYAAPDEVLLPGFHTAAETALKKRGPEEAGEDVFRSVCGLMACGAQTVLLSQWRSGGQTSFDLMREFAQELPHTSASEAWQRSVELVMAAKVNPTREPRVKLNSKQDPPNAAHPFFWAGYLLVDTGATSEPGVEPAADPDPKPARPGAGAPPAGAAAAAGAPPAAAVPQQPISGAPLPTVIEGPDPALDGEGAIGGDNLEDEGVKPKPKAKAPKAKPAKPVKPKPTKKPAATK